MRILIFLIFFALSMTVKGQSIDVHTEKFKGVKKLTVKSFNACCSKKGYRSVYFFDDKGNAIRSVNFFKCRKLASYVYKYNDDCLITEEIQTFDINNKNRVDTTRYVYSFDTNNRLVSKITYFGKWKIEETYNDFDSNSNARSVIETFSHTTIIAKRTFDSQNRIILRQRFKNDTLNYEEQIRYNEYNDIVYSSIPTLLDKKTGKMRVLIGGNRHSAAETYGYKYDRQNRWTEKYLIVNDKKILLEKRKYR